MLPATAADAARIPSPAKRHFAEFRAGVATDKRGDSHLRRSNHAELRNYVEGERHHLRTIRAHLRGRGRKLLCFGSQHSSRKYGFLAEKAKQCSGKHQYGEPALHGVLIGGGIIEVTSPEHPLWLLKDGWPVSLATQLALAGTSRGCRSASSGFPGL